MVEPEKTDVSRQQLGKHIPVATNTHTHTHSTCQDQPSARNKTKPDDYLFPELLITVDEQNC